jgi:hypothetical protein
MFWNRNGAQFRLDAGYPDPGNLAQTATVQAQAARVMVTLTE